MRPALFRIFSHPSRRIINAPIHFYGSSSNLDNKHLFALYMPSLSEQLAQQVSGDIIASKDEPLELIIDQNLSKRFQQVLRMKSGDSVELFDGELACQVQLRMANSQHGFVATTVQGTLHRTPAITPKINLYCGLLKKKESFEEILEACGLYQANVQPLITQKSVAASDWWTSGKSNTSQKLIERFDSIIIAAMEQSKQFVKPQLHNPVSFSDWSSALLARSRNNSCGNANTLNLFCDIHDESVPIVDILHGNKKSVREVNLVIGPEGDFTTHESSVLVQTLGFKRTKLSTLSVLRSTEAVRLALGTIRCFEYPSRKQQEGEHAVDNEKL